MFEDVCVVVGCEGIELGGREVGSEELWKETRENGVGTSERGKERKIREDRREEEKKGRKQELNLRRKMVGEERAEKKKSGGEIVRTERKFKGYRGED